MRKLATKESVVKMVEQEFKKNQALLAEKTDKVIELEGSVQKSEQDVERLKREVRLAKSSEASDEVVERMKKEKDELKKIATAMETRKNQYKQLVKNKSILKLNLFIISSRIRARTKAMKSGRLCEKSFQSTTNCSTMKK